MSFTVPVVLGRDDAASRSGNDIMTPRKADLKPVDPCASLNTPSSDATRERLKELVDKLRYKGINPFVPRVKVGCYEYFKVVFFLVTGIAIVRILLVALILLFMSLLASMASCCLPTGAPMSWWRRALVSPHRFLCRVMMFIAGFYWVTVNDFRKDKKSKGQILAPNHIAIWDPVYLHYYCGISPAAKADLFQIPIMGSLLRSAFQAIPIERATAAGRIASIDRLVKRAGDVRYPNLCVFPEGTTHNDQTLIMFKRGVFIPGKPVVPVVLEYPNSFYDMFFGTKGIGHYFFHSCCQFINYHRVTLLEEYVPSEAEKKNYMLFARGVRAKMHEYLSKSQYVEITDHSWADVKLFTIANKKFASEDLVVEKSLALFKMTVGEFDELVNRFLEKDANHNGLIGLDEFMDLVGLKRQLPEDVETASAIFALLDTDHNGQLDFVEFIAAFGALNANDEVVRSLPNLLDKILVNVKKAADSAVDPYRNEDDV